VAARSGVRKLADLTRARLFEFRATRERLRKRIPVVKQSAARVGPAPAPAVALPPRVSARKNQPMRPRRETTINGVRMIDFAETLVDEADAWG